MAERTPEEESPWQDFAAHCFEKYGHLGFDRASIPLYNLGILEDPSIDLGRKIAAVMRLLAFESKPVVLSRPGPRRKKHPGGHPGISQSTLEHFKRTLVLVTLRLFKPTQTWPTQTEVMEQWPDGYSESTWRRRFRTLAEQGEWDSWSDFISRIKDTNDL